MSNEMSYVVGSHGTCIKNLLTALNHCEQQYWDSIWRDPNCKKVGADVYCLGAPELHHVTKSKVVVEERVADQDVHLNKENEKTIFNSWFNHEKLHFWNEILYFLHQKKYFFRRKINYFPYALQILFQHFWDVADLAKRI